MEMSTLKWEKWIVILILIFVSLYSDWALLAPVFTILFAKSKGNRIKQQYHLESEPVYLQDLIICQI